MRILISLTAVTLLVMSFQVYACAQYESQSYLPLTRSELSRRFPITYVGTLGLTRPGYFEDMTDKPIPSNIGIGPSGATIKATSDDYLIISGLDKAQKSWSVELGASPSYACRFYRGDLDKDGIQDAVLLFPTGGNGLAPTSHILTITFDGTGRPVTFEAEGYFQDLDGKLFDLVDLNRNGRADLIYMNFDSGYWITNIYEVRDARWRRVAGRHGNRSYPLYTRFTNNENHRPTAPKRGRHPFAPNLSNNAPIISGRLISYEWADVGRSENISLNLKDKRGNTVLSQPVSWYSSFAVVLDTPESRKIVSLSGDPETLKSLLDSIVSGNYEVALFGNRSRAASSPELLWATGK